MASRTDLQTLLESTLGSSNVYFQPPPSLQMGYPCIVYSRSDIDTAYAANLPYKLTNEYELIAIDSDPDSDIPDNLAALPRCAFSRAYQADQLNHYVFTIIF